MKTLFIGLTTGLAICILWLLWQINYNLSLMSNDVRAIRRAIDQREPPHVMFRMGASEQSPEQERMTL